MSVNLSDDERSHLARALMQLFDQWDLDLEQRVVLLDLPEGTKSRTLTRYRNGEPIPEGSDLLERAKYLLGIQHSLEIALPMNAAIIQAWPTTENSSLQNRRPLDVMLDHGVDGMKQVYDLLTGNDDWG
ncbi:MAG: hypothetical protein LJE56_06745 [Acidiferrobacterales bacterium]|jgi:hypothetical protein|nr:hypothetical protein [Acidiferrobacterales bacterium]